MDNVFTRPYIHTDILEQQIIKDRTLPWKQEIKDHLLVIAALVFCALLFVWSRTEVVQVGYEISQANKVYHDFIKENHRLQVEIVSLNSPSRIEKIAQNKLELGNPKPEQIIILP